MTKNKECKRCGGKGEYLQFHKPFAIISEDGNPGQQWATEVKCQWCIGTGIHTPLSEDPYL